MAEQVNLIENSANNIEVGVGEVVTSSDTVGISTIDLPQNYLQVTSATISDTGPDSEVTTVNDTSTIHAIVTEPGCDIASPQVLVDTHAFASNTSDAVSATTITPSKDADPAAETFPCDAKCLVCNDKASGLHYGILACEGCKGFFRRALQDVGDPSRRRCYYNKNCEITVSTRNRCQYCRLQKCLELGMSRGAAKLGRRSRKMRESIAETCKNIEDNQTAQALHGLLSLKADSSTDAATTSTVATASAVVGKAVSECDTLVRQSDGAAITLVSSPDLPSIIIEQPPAITSSVVGNLSSSRDASSTIQITSSSSTHISLTPGNASATLAGAAQQVIDSHTGQVSQKKLSSDSEILLMQKLQHARQMNSEVFNRNENRRKNSELKKAKQLEQQNNLRKAEGISVLKLSQLNSDSSPGSASSSGTKLLIVNTNKVPLSQQTFITTPTGEVIDMSQVQIINAAPNVKVANTSNKVFIPSSGIDTSSLLVTNTPAATGKIAVSAATSSSTGQLMFKSPLKKRPYRSEYQEVSSGKQMRLGDPCDISSGSGAAAQVVIVDSVAADSSTVPELQSVNMADVASTVYDAYLETVQFTFSNTVTMRQNISDKLVCPASSPTLDDHLATVCWKAYETRFNEAITDVVNFAKRIPGFAALETDDQIILIKGGSFEVACVMQSSFIDPTQEIMLLSGIDSAYTKQQLRNSFLMGATFVDLLFNFAGRFSGYHLTDVETALFCALMLIRPDRGGLTNREKVNKLQEILIQALQSQMELNHKSESGLFPKVLMMVSALRELNGEQRRVLSSLKGQIEFAEGLLAEIFDLTE